MNPSVGNRNPQRAVVLSWFNRVGLRKSKIICSAIVNDPHPTDPACCYEVAALPSSDVLEKWAVITIAAAGTLEIRVDEPPQALRNLAPALLAP
ncbi:MAG: hypothetical protein AAB393_00130 [Bacteroidota bacterium]